MNEAKPIVTCHGNKSLFTSLNPLVAQGLPKEPCEWRRSYGRAPRMVNLEASLVPYDADILPEEEEKTLVSRPYFHLYWADGDVEAYKQTVKDDITEWLSALKARNIQDWLIVVVNSEESKVKAKLLPRSSVIDKVKSDFCSKYQERCIVLTEPNKLDSKSSESWSQLFQKLRSLLLQAFNRHLTKYEENMRSRREKRNEPGWNYFSYFIIQEELAFMLEMLGLKEDALIQYDELDAMFDQFVENFANGDTVKWLTHVIKPCTSWAGVSLAKSLDLELREEVKQNNASLLEFRNYLFCRQAALLFQMGRAWEVAMRAMDYLYNTVVEMKALEVEAPSGAVCCWGFLGCLEVLHACTVHNASQLDEKFALYTANLWDFAHKKLRELGHLCSLMPGLVPTSAQLSLVVDLVSGMGLSAETISNSEQKPVDKLRESLSSPESFKKHYLDMCEQAMGTYKYIGRYRSARMIGLELADFYMKIKEPYKAENFLLDSIRMYQQEGWHRLADGTLLQLAACQRLLKDPDKYLKTSCHIACSPHLAQSDRSNYFNELIETLEKYTECKTEMRASHAVFIENITLSSDSICLNEELKLTVDLFSNFPNSITFDEVKISLHSCKDSELTEHDDQSQNQQRNKTHNRQPSGTLISFEKMANFQPVTKNLPSQIDFSTSVERSKGRLVSCAIECASAHQLLKRSDSAPSTNNSTAIHKDDFTNCFSHPTVTLTSGYNSLTFTKKMNQKGVFQLGQICLRIKSLDLLKSVSSKVIFKVVSVEPTFTLTPKETNHFVCGINQEGVLSCSSGSYSLKDSSTLSFTTEPLFNLTNTNNTEDVLLNAMDPHTVQDIPVNVYMKLDKDSASMVKSKINLTVNEWKKSLSSQIEFVHPFRADHRVYTSGKQKYFQIVIHGTTKANFVLSSPCLETPSCKDVEFILLNRPDQILPVNEHQSLSLLWQLNSNIPVVPSLDIVFSCTYSSVLHKSNELHQYEYSCCIQDFQTLYILSYTVSSIEEDKSCTTGETAILDIKIKQVKETNQLEGVKLAYSVHANGNVWAIGGKSTGVFTMKESKYSIALDVVPMQPGFLHFPLVSLHKYMDLIEDHGSDEHTESDKESSQIHTTSRAKRTVSQISTSSTSSQFTSHLVDFNPGQVYNESRSRQIHVNPCQTTSDIDVSLVH
ncbi:trafficking protein particle complex subunit 10-like [Physella acuta]|uniref:trafficking protein particle complex subunit 10-like n=1 Tax=Physella acuta TaxID=109671 RepID=UPI0027DE8FDE|nr:trafficking protein particle complex subunit 10-like [Physella acuta]